MQRVQVGCELFHAGLGFEALLFFLVLAFVLFSIIFRFSATDRSLSFSFPIIAALGILAGLAGTKGIVTGDVGEVACIVDGEYADVVATADLEAVYAAV